MKKILKIIYIILIVILIKLLFSFIMNEIFIAKYDDGEYEESDVKKMLILNIVQPYIAHYNYGNVLYKNANYDEAILEYEKALKLFPSEEKECSIRINLALAKLAKIDNDDTIEEKIKVLKDARAILCEDGCANENNEKGHSKKAERLKKDIDSAIEELMNNNSQPSDGGDDKEDEEDDDNSKNDEQKKKTIEEQLKEIQREGRTERNEDLDSIKQMMDSDYSYDRKNW